MPTRMTDVAPTSKSAWAGPSLTLGAASGPAGRDGLIDHMGLAIPLVPLYRLNKIMALGEVEEAFL